MSNKTAWWKKSVVYQVYPKSFVIQMETGSGIRMESAKKFLSCKAGGGCSLVESDLRVSAGG